MLRATFADWGRPHRLRVDNGTPWGSRGDLPTDLVCWLVGLDVAVTANPPRRPRANGVVERAQGVGQQWAEPPRCQSTAELQQRLDRLDHWQRDRYPIRGGLSRMALHPGLAHSGRPYDPTTEATQWSLAAVRELLAGHVVPRRVDQQGKVSLYNRLKHVGACWSGQTVWVGFDPETGAWTFLDAAGHEIRQASAPELSAATIQGLQVTHRRRGAHAAQRSDANQAA